MYIYMYVWRVDLDGPIGPIWQHFPVAHKSYGNSIYNHIYWVKRFNIFRLLYKCIEKRGGWCAGVGVVFYCWPKYATLTHIHKSWHELENVFLNLILPIPPPWSFMYTMTLNETQFVRWAAAGGRRGVPLRPPIHAAAAHLSACVDYTYEWGPI